MDSAAIVTSFDLTGYLQSVGMVLLMLIVLWYVLHRIKKNGQGFFPSTGKSLLRLEAQLPIGRNKSVCVVRFQDRQLVIGVTEHQIQLLADNSVEKTADTAQPTKGFAGSVPPVTGFVGSVPPVTGFVGSVPPVTNSPQPAASVANSLADSAMPVPDSTDNSTANSTVNFPQTTANFAADSALPSAEDQKKFRELLK